MSRDIGTETVEDDITVVRVAGWLTVGSLVEELDNKIKDLLDAHKTRIVLETSGVKYIDSTGLGCLVRSLTKTLMAGGNLVIAKPSQKSREIFSTTRLHAIFPSFDSIEDAVAYLRKNPRWVEAEASERNSGDKP